MKYWKNLINQQKVKEEFNSIDYTPEVRWSLQKQQRIFFANAWFETIRFKTIQKKY